MSSHDRTGGKGERVGDTSVGNCRGRGLRREPCESRLATQMVKGYRIEDTAVIPKP